jgi:hypothetical protein
MVVVGLMCSVTGRVTISLPFPPQYRQFRAPVWEQVENWKRFIRICKSLARDRRMAYTITFDSVYLEGNGGMTATIRYGRIGQ